MTDDVDFEKKLEELGTLQFTDAEIARIAKMPVKELIRDYADSIDRGRLLAEAEVRKSIIKAAKEGNSQAQKQFLDMNKMAKSARG